MFVIRYIIAKQSDEFSRLGPKRIFVIVENQLVSSEVAMYDIQELPGLILNPESKSLNICIRLQVLVYFSGLRNVNLLRCNIRVQFDILRRCILVVGGARFGHEVIAALGACVAAVGKLNVFEGGLWG
jgi:hypothetical protein